MQQKNECGEQARDYFVKVEDKAKDLVLILKQASEDPMKLLKLHYEALGQVDKRVEIVDSKVGTLEDRRIIFISMDNIEDISKQPKASVNRIWADYNNNSAISS